LPAGNCHLVLAFKKVSFVTRGVLIDLPTAAKYSKLAADQNPAFAQANSGRFLDEGLGFPIDLVEGTNV
jgi:TPR repeat protein